MTLRDKVKTVATEIYRASDIACDASVETAFKDLEAGGFGKLPVCMAKTQYSFSTDPNKRGAPTGHVVPVRELRLSAGAEFVVVITGEIMTMPGLPRVPASEVDSPQCRRSDRGSVLRRSRKKLSFLCRFSRQLPAHKAALSIRFAATFRSLRA